MVEPAPFASDGAVAGTSTSARTTKPAGTGALATYWFVHNVSIRQITVDKCHDTEQKHFCQYAMIAAVPSCGCHKTDATPC